MSTIFIRHDNALAERIRDCLKDKELQRPQEQRLHSSYLDSDLRHGIQAGEHLRDQLFEHLQLCVAVIVIFSEAYGALQWCPGWRGAIHGVRGRYDRGKA